MDDVIVVTVRSWKAEHCSIVVSSHEATSRSSQFDRHKMDRLGSRELLWEGANDLTSAYSRHEPLVRYTQVSVVVWRSESNGGR